MDGTTTAGDTAPRMKLYDTKSWVIKNRRKNLEKPWPSVKLRVKRSRIRFQHPGVCLPSLKKKELRIYLF